MYYNVLQLSLLSSLPTVDIHHDGHIFDGRQDEIAENHSENRADDLQATLIVGVAPSKVRIHANMWDASCKKLCFDNRELLISLSGEKTFDRPQLEKAILTWLDERRPLSPRVTIDCSGPGGPKPEASEFCAKLYHELVSTFATKEVLIELGRASMPDISN